MYMGISFPKPEEIPKPEEKYRAPRNDMAGIIANSTVELRDEISKNQTRIYKLKRAVEDYLEIPDGLRLKF